MIGPDVGGRYVEIRVRAEISLLNCSHSTSSGAAATEHSPGPHMRPGHCKHD